MEESADPKPPSPSKQPPPEDSPEPPTPQPLKINSFHLQYQSDLYTTPKNNSISPRKHAIKSKSLDIPITTDFRKCIKEFECEQNASELRDTVEDPPTREPGNQADLPGQPSKLKNLLLRYFPYYVSIPNKLRPKYPGNRLELLFYEPLFLKNGTSLYNALFGLELAIFFFFIMFYDQLIGSSKGFTEALAKNRFAGEMVCVIVLIIGVILFNRVCYTKKFSVLNHKVQIAGGLGRSSQKELKKSESYNIYWDHSNLSVSPTPASKESGGEPEPEPQKTSFKLLSNKHSLTFRFVVHVVLVGVLHYFFFFVMPQKNKSTFSSLTIANVCYSLFFVYFSLSALQIRDGFCPNDLFTIYKREIPVLENALRHVYRSVPFIFEIKSAIDWCTTDTSLDLFQWIKLEEARLHLFLVKYQMQLRKKYTQPIQFSYKITGWFFLFFLVGIAIFPLFLFSSLNPNYSVAAPFAASLRLDLLTSQDGIDRTFNLFSTQTEDVSSISKEQFSKLKKFLADDLDIKDEELQSQVSKIRFDAFPADDWQISLPKKQQLISILQQSLKVEAKDPSKCRRPNSQSSSRRSFSRWPGL